MTIQVRIMADAGNFRSVDPKLVAAIAHVPNDGPWTATWEELANQIGWSVIRSVKLVEQDDKELPF